MRVPYLNINPSTAVPTEKAKKVKLINDRMSGIKPIRVILKPNTKIDRIELIISTIHAFSIPESVCARIYSLSIRGAMKRLLKFLDQIFQRLPTETEYSMIQMI